MSTLRSLVLSLACLLVTTSAVSSQSLPRLSELPDAWSRIYPGEPASCALGEPYFFMVRPGDPERLMINFQGGGGCRSYGSCLHGGYVSSLAAKTTDLPDHDATGFHDLDHPDNPVSEFTMVDVEYCTGDAHLGSRDFTYRRPDDWDRSEDPAERVVRHRGALNVMAVLDWVARELPDPEVVFVTGSSSGGIGSPFWTGPIAQRYPDAEVFLLAFGAGGYRGAPKDPADPNGRFSFVRGHPGFEGLELQDMSVARLFVGTARAYPGARLAMANSAGDRAQASRIPHADVPLSELMDRNVAQIRAADPDFLEFRVGGNEHDVDLYSYAVDGVRLADWVRAYLTGEQPGSRVCDDCTSPDFVFTDRHLAVLERAAVILSDEERWNPEDRPGCEDDEREQRWSLTCALALAAAEIDGKEEVSYWGAPIPLQAIVYGNQLGDPDQRTYPRIWQWHNEPTRSFGDVKRVLRATIQRVRAELRTR